MKNAILSFALVITGLTSSCAAVVVAGSAVVLTDEFQNNAVTATMAQETDLVWCSVRSSLAHMTDSMIHTEEDLKVAWTFVDNAAVTVHVKTWNAAETQISVSAKKGLYTQELATYIQDRIVKELGL